MNMMIDLVVEDGEDMYEVARSLIGGKSRAVLVCVRQIPVGHSG